jgi:hypothetical protein
MSNKSKYAIALLVAPIAAPCLYLLGILIFEMRNSLGGVEPEVFFNQVLLVVIITSYLGLLFLGLPYFYVLKRFHLDSTLTLTIGGMFLGIVAFFLALKPLGLNISSLRNANYIEIVFLVSIGALLGGSVAFSFARMRS